MFTSSLWLLGLLSSTVVVATQYVSPFFYLCSFQQPDLDQFPNDIGEVAISVSVDGDPQFYVPGQLYNGIEHLFIVNRCSCYTAVQ